MIKVTTDFETQSDCDLKKAGAWEYSMHPTTRVLCLSFKRNDSQTCFLFDFATMQLQWKSLPKKFRYTWQQWVNDPNFIFSAHNAYFEQCIYENILVRRLGWPKLVVKKWRCTAVKAAAAALPRNLADAGAVARTAVQKDYEGHRVMMKLCKPTAAWKKWNTKLSKAYIKEPRKVQELIKKEPVKYWTPKNNPDDFKKLYHYCKIDVLSEEKLDEALPDLTPFEQRLWFIDQRINLRGIKVDIPLIKKISQIMAAEAKVMNKELDVLTMGLVASGNARKAILDFLTLEGLELPNLQAKTVDDFLENGKATGDAEKILKIRKALAKSSTAKYQNFLVRSATDGRVRDMLLFLGAQRTGRWAGKGIQPQNFPRGVIKDIYEAIYRINTCSVEDLKLLYGENLMPLFSSVLRGMFIADKGKELFVEDYNAIECRVLFWLADHKKGLKIFHDGRDPYLEMAARIYNKSVLKIDKEGNERQVGKAAVLGCGFGMGGKKFVTSAWEVYRAFADKSMAKIAVSTYREIHYPVVEMWENYQNAAIAAVENPGKWFRVSRVRFGRFGRFLKIELPSGRCLSYCDPKIEQAKTIILEKKIDGEVDRAYASNVVMLKKFLDEGYKKVNHFYSKRLCYFEINQKAKKEDCVIPKWTIERTYGGKLVENVVQAVSRDLLAAAIVRAEEKGFEVLMHSHDETVSQAPIGKHFGLEYRKIMETLPAWAAGLPIKSSGWSNERYRKG